MVPASMDMMRSDVTVLPPTCAHICALILVHIDIGSVATSARVCAAWCGAPSAAQSAALSPPLIH